jgi:lysophospholipase L1-like esterase
MLLCCECGARLWLGCLASPGQVARYGSADQSERRARRYSRHHYLPFIPTPGWSRGKNRHNSLGYRGEEVAVPKPRGVFRIAVLGGSTIYTVEVDDYRESFPYQLQQELRRNRPAIEVVNAGCPMYSSWESLMNLELRVLDLQPDLVMVYHGINDVHARLVYPGSAYVGDNSGSRRPYDPPEESLWDRSALLRIARTDLGFRAHETGQLYFRTFHGVPTNHAEDFRQQVLEGTYPSGVFEQRTAQEMLHSNVPTYFARNLRNMVAISRMNHAEAVLLTFAWSPHFQDPRVSSAEYQSAYEEQNALVLDICREHEVPCYDLSREMPRDPGLWTDGRHVNARGAAVKARLVARFLESSKLLPEVGEGDPLPK